MTATPSHRAAPGLGPKPVPHDLRHSEGDDCHLHLYFVIPMFVNKTQVENDNKMERDELCQGNLTRMPF